VYRITSRANYLGIIFFKRERCSKGHTGMFTSHVGCFAALQRDPSSYMQKGMFLY